jgi:hypothetical protein
MANSYGQIMRVGKKSFDPPNTIANLQGWFDAQDASTITLSTADITQWNDKSGNGRNLTTTRTASRPVYTANAINGYYAAYFDQLAEIFSSPFTSIGTTRTVFLIIKPTLADTGTYQFIISFENANVSNGLLKNNGSDKFTIVNGLTFIEGESLVTNRVDLWTSVFNSTSSSTQLNDNTPITGNPGNDVCDIFCLGSNYWNANILFKGYLGEVIVYSGVLSAGDQATVKEYLKDKWSL